MKLSIYQPTSNAAWLRDLDRLADFNIAYAFRDDDHWEARAIHREGYWITIPTPLFTRTGALLVGSRWWFFWSVPREEQYDVLKGFRQDANLIAHKWRKRGWVVNLLPRKEHLELELCGAGLDPNTSGAIARYIASGLSIIQALRWAGLVENDERLTPAVADVLSTYILDPM